jgi:hypothetical protein
VSAKAESPQNEPALRAELDEARSRLEGLVGELHVIDSMLEESATERQRYALVREALGALEKLSGLGAAELFWGERPAGGSPDLHVERVRRRVEEFERRVGELERSRQSLLDRIRGAEENTEYLEDDLDQARLREEMRKLEWVVEREIGPVPDCEPVMPWFRGGDDDQRFRKSLATSLLLALLLGLVVPRVDLPVPERWEVIQVPERMTRLIAEATPPEPPPAIQQELIPEAKLADAADEEPRVARESTPEPAQNTKSKGILAFRDKFSALADAKSAARLGAQARIDRSGEAAIGRGGRSLVASQAPGSSGGIDLASLSRDAVGGGGQEIEGVEIGRATSSIGGIAGANRPLSGGPGLGRTDEEIQIVFDRRKAALYRLYNRELRRDPTLRGQIVLRMTIEPDGSVSLCELQASDMDAPALSTQIVARVKAFDFGAKEDIPAITILYPIDFLPAT